MKQHVNSLTTVTELMKQKQYAPMSVAEQALSLFSAEKGYLNDVDVSDVLSFESSLISYAKTEHAEFYAQLNETGDYSKEIEGQFHSILETFKATQTW
jgi:F-type H+-transporting ATPase subunit alpha